MSVKAQKLVEKKRVNVHCARPFRIGHTPFAGVCSKLVLSVKDISICLENKALVREILKNGELVPLDFTNYNTWNGPSDVEPDAEESIAENFKEAEVEVLNNKGKVEKVINENKPEPPKVIIKHKDYVETTEPEPEKPVVSDNVESDTTTETDKDPVKEDIVDGKVEVEKSTETINNSNNNNKHNNNFKKNKFK